MMAHSNTGFTTGGHKGSICIEPMKTIGAQDLLKDDENITHVGWLYKRDNAKNYESINKGIHKMAAKFPMLKSRWKNYYMIVHKGSFYIYNNDSSKKPKNCFSLLGYKRVMRAHDTAAPDSKSFAFKLIHVSPEERTWYFATGSDREMQTWMAVIKSEIEKHSHGEVTGQTQRLVMGLKRPSLTLSHDSISLDDDDAIYNALEVDVKYDEEDLSGHNYSDLMDSGEDENENGSDSDSYEEPWEDEKPGTRTSVIDRPLPLPPGAEIDNRPPAKLPTSPVSQTTRPPMPIPGSAPSPSPKPQVKRLPGVPGGAQPPILRPWEQNTPPKPSHDKGPSPATQPPKSRPWEKTTPPIPAPRPDERSNAPTGGVMMMPGLFQGVKLRNVDQSQGFARSEPDGQSTPNSVSENSRKDRRDSYPNKKMPMVPPNRPAVPSPRNRPPPPTKRKIVAVVVPEPQMLPPSANIDSCDKTLTDQYLNEYSEAGMYLVRKSREPGALVLVVFDGPKKACLHYKVFSNTEEGTIYLQSDHPAFSTMEALLKHYTTHALPTTKQKLTKPYPGPKKN